MLAIESAWDVLDSEEGDEVSLRVRMIAELELIINFDHTASQTS